MNECHITFDPQNQDNIIDYVKLSKVQYGDLPTVTSIPHLIWKHIKTPFGPSIAVNLKDGDNIVGRVMLQPKTAYLNGKERPIAFVTDALVHPDYRRPITNFWTLIKSVRNAKQFAVVFHASNENTENIYRRVLKFSCPFSLKGYGLPLKLSKSLPKKYKIINLCLKIVEIPYQLVLMALLSLSKLFTTIKISDTAPDKATFDQFCHQEDVKNNFLVTRNQEALKWRFQDTEMWRADILHIYQDKKYCGYVVLRKMELFDVNFSVIMDFIVSSELSVIQVWCLRSLLVKKAISNKSDIIFTLLNPKSRASRKFLGFPFIGVPDKFLPHSTPMFVHVLDQELISMEKEQGLHITLGDLDYF